MKLTDIIAVGLAVLLLTAGAAAAMPGSAPAFAGDDAQTDENGQDGQDDDHPSERAANASDARSDAVDGDERASVAENRGQEADLPDAVPDHVAAIHDLIRQFVAGDLGGALGDAVSDVTPDDESAES